MGLTRWLEYFEIYRSGYFDPDYYLINNPDVRFADVDPLWHFVNYGWKEGRNPSRKFDVRFYLSTYPDVKSAAINPLFHYLKFGQKENRQPRAKPIHKEKEKELTGQLPDPYHHHRLLIYKTRKIGGQVFKYTSPTLKASIVIPNYNGKKFLEECISSLRRQKFPREQFEIIIVDNASSDGSQEFIRHHFADVKLVTSTKNLGYAGGCNLGASHSKGEYIIFLNNDTVVDKNWLRELVSVAESDNETVIVGSKLLFKNNPLIIQNAGSYITDRGEGGDTGFGQKDVGQYDSTREVIAVCGASMLVKRSFIEEAGSFDEDFHAYYEDTDLCYRARLLGKKVVFAHRSIVYHIHAATLGEWSPQFSFFVHRNKLFLHLKNSPISLFLRVLFLYLRQVTKDMLHRRNRRVHFDVFCSFLRKLPNFLVKRFYIRFILKTNDDKRVLLRLSKLKPRISSLSVKRICIYNAYLPTLGGGEKLTAYFIKSFSEFFPSASIDILLHETTAFPNVALLGKELLETFKREFDIGYANIHLRYLKIYPSLKNKRHFLNKLITLINEAKLSLISQEYDIFVNITFASELPAYAKLNVYSCMFPTRIEKRKGLMGYLYAQKKNHFLKSYDLFLAISNYTQHWIDKYWGVNSFVLYPPVANKVVEIPNNLKENLIINIGRFFIGNHNKKQDVLIKAFIKLCEKGWAEGWKLVLIGRKHKDKDSEIFVQSLSSLSQGYPIKLLHDIEKEELNQYLRKAKIYWHATGYGEDLELNPEKFEHFGLSTIEAMQFGAVPLVYNAGGQPEIVRHGINGFIWNNIDELIQYTKHLISSENLWASYSQAAKNSISHFTEEASNQKLHFLFEQYINWNQ